MSPNVWRKHAAPHRRLRMSHSFPAPVRGGASTLWCVRLCFKSASPKVRAKCLRVLCVRCFAWLNHQPPQVDADSVVSLTPVRHALGVASR